MVNITNQKSLCLYVFSKQDVNLYPSGVRLDYRKNLGSTILSTFLSLNYQQNIKDNVV